jgi:hypothetical protein
LCAILVQGLLASPAHAVVKPADLPTAPALPEIWQKVPASERLKALRAAEVDSTRLLTERIVGMKIDSDTTVRDLLFTDDSIRGVLSGSIRGIATSEAPEYFPDGRVQVVKALMMQQVFEVVNKLVKQVKNSDGTVKTVSATSQSETTRRNEKLEVVGSSALPNSEGLLKIRAKRAAEADVYRKLGERMLGVKITGNTTVKDLALQKDEVAKVMAGLVKGAEFTAIQYATDGSCSVTAQIRTGDVIRTISRTVNGKTSLEDSIESDILSETGNGVASATTDSAGPDSGVVEEVQISETIRRLVSEDPAK